MSRSTRPFCDKYQTSADEVLGRKGIDLFSTDIANRFEESDRHVMETGEMSISRQRQIARDGVERDVVTQETAYRQARPLFPRRHYAGPAERGRGFR